MYEVTVTRPFVAQHYLTVPDPGPEGELHSHAFEVEVTVRGPELNEYGYLVDIDDVKAAMASLLDRYRDATLNDLPEFEGQNPSVERLARAFADRFVSASGVENPDSVRVCIWEDDEACAVYERPV
jgi:6-pyruvoyltetrahydropterin/6-carboxytetrahydropterin synthase